MLSPEIIHNLTTNSNAAIVPGVERMQQILALLNNPHNSYKTIHITGTNGKGSTASFIATGLIHAGFRVGKFTSPHIHTINEDITLNNQNISDADLTHTYSIIKNIITLHQITLSPFELLTTIMFYYFASVDIDYLVLEVGLGGLNDATNVVDSILAIITNISIEHTQFLGNTLAEIAYQKTGIIKPHSYVIVGSSQMELLDAVKHKTNNYISIINKYDIDIKLDAINFKTNLCIRENLFTKSAPTNKQDYQLSLFGKFQAYNFLCAYETLRKLNIPEESIAYAASNTILPYRIQLVSTAPNIIMDATHNPDGAKQLYLSLANICLPSDVVIITSILADKDIPQMLYYFNQLADSIIFTSITNTSRALTANQLATIACNSDKCNFLSIEVINEPNHAFKFAKAMNKKMIIITGSFYLLSYYDNY